jgi:hypothetical protein
MEAVRVLRKINQANKRKVTVGGPTSFVPKKWKPFVFPDDPAKVNWHGWELCLLSELRGRLRSGDVYLEGFRRYADPESYLILKFL